MTSSSSRSSSARGPTAEVGERSDGSEERSSAVDAVLGELGEGRQLALDLAAIGRRSMVGSPGHEVVDQVPVTVERQRQRAQLGGVDVGAWSSRIVRSSSGSSRSWSRMRAQRRSKATAEDTSSSTSTLGGRPASTGCSESSRWAKECSVPMAAPSSWASAVRRSVGLARPWPAASLLELARACGRGARPPAFSVKVMAAMLAQLDRSADDEGDRRPTSAVVLPEPAPASTNSVVSRSVAMRSRALVGRREAGGGHPSPSSEGSARSTYSTSTGSCRLRSHWRRSSAVPRPSGSQVWHSIQK